MTDTAKTQRLLLREAFFQDLARLKEQDLLVRKKSGKKLDKHLRLVIIDTVLGEKSSRDS